MTGTELFAAGLLTLAAFGGVQLVDVASEALTHDAAPPIVRLIGDVPPYSGCTVANAGTEAGITSVVVTRCWPQ